MNALLSVKDLKVSFNTDEGVVRALKGVSFDIAPKSTLGLVGESGSGKSVSALSIMRLLAAPVASIDSGEVRFCSSAKDKPVDLLSLDARSMRRVRGKRIGMIFQEPMTSLNPVFTVGDQIAESLMLHEGMGRKEALQASVDLLHQVGIPKPQSRVQSYPHEMSGGQRQRVMIAMAIACKPELLIADEPTTALDVTIQKQILDLIASLQQQFNMSVLFITHDLGVVSHIADRVVVMFRGSVVEQGPTAQIFTRHKHPYTKGLIMCRPSLQKNPLRLATVNDFMTLDGQAKEFDLEKIKTPKTIPKMGGKEHPVLLEVKSLSTHFCTKRNFFGKAIGWLKAVDGVSFKVHKGTTFGLVGESGCGKTTLGRSVLRLVEPHAGDVIYNGVNLRTLKPQALRQWRKKMQIIFQDPYASLNPRMTVGEAIAEPMRVHGIGTAADRRDRAAALLERVELSAGMLSRYPHEFSGGQRQRVCIARALSTEPEFIICDESVSALDVSVQAQILNLLRDLQERYNLTYIFISHDLAVVKFISHELAVMNQGKIVELSDALSVYERPQHPYTKQLLSAILA